MSVSHIVFDLDGTLIDSVTICTHLVNSMLADRGSARCVSIDLVRSHISTGGTKMIKALLGDACSDPNQDIKEFRARYSVIATPINCLFPGVRAGLLALRKEGYDLSICSNKPQALCEKVLTDLNLKFLFEVIVGGDTVDQIKPNPEHLDYILRRIGGQRNCCIMVGDSEIDLALARNAKIPCILVKYGYGNFSEYPSDALCVDSFSDVIHCVSLWKSQ